MELLRSIGVICVSAFLALAAGEVALRLMGIHYSDSFYDFDFQTGWHLRPGARAGSAPKGKR